MTAPDALTPQIAAADVEAAWSDPKLANVLYHDWEASTYDEKWSISFDQRCIDYARDRFEHVAGDATGWPYGEALEIGCGTGFFLLNLMQAGVRRRRGHVTDISPGHGRGGAAQRRRARASTSTAGSRTPRRCRTTTTTFDLVVGHAVLHHIPDVEQALREVLRVLKPGGRFVFAGEPTRCGDFVARRLSRLDLVGGDARDPAARLRERGRGPGRARRVVAGGRAGGGRRPAHLRPGRHCAATARARRRGRRRGP